MKNKGLLRKNQYVFTPIQFGEEKITLENLLIETIVSEIRDSNDGSRYRQLYFISCYTDSNIEYYKVFFKNLFKRLNEFSGFQNPIQRVEILFNSLKFEKIEFSKLKRFFKSSKKFGNCEFDIRVSNESFMHAKTIALRFGQSGDRGVLFCTSANFTTRGYTTNREYILRTDNKISLNHFFDSFDSDWRIANTNPRFGYELFENESLSTYILKGKMLIDGPNSSKIPFKNPLSLDVKSENINSERNEMFKRINVELDDSKKINWHVDRYLFYEFFGYEFSETIEKLFNRRAIRNLCSDFHDTYWITPHAFERLQKKQDFDFEISFFNEMVVKFKEKLKDKESFLKEIDRCLPENFLNYLSSEVSKEEFCDDIYEHLFKSFQADSDINWQNLYNLVTVESNLADSKGEVQVEFAEVIARGFIKTDKFNERYKELFSSFETVDLDKAAALNDDLFLAHEKSQKEKREKLNKSLLLLKGL